MDWVDRLDACVYAHTSHNTAYTHSHTHTTHTQAGGANTNEQTSRQRTKNERETNKGTDLLGDDGVALDLVVPRQEEDEHRALLSVVGGGWICSLSARVRTVHIESRMKKTSKCI